MKRTARIIILLVFLLAALPVQAETEWTKWFLIFVEADKIEQANTLAANWDPDDGSTTFGVVKLSPDGELPITHYACSTPSTATMRDGITNALEKVAWSSMYWTDNIYPGEGETVYWVGPDGWTFEDEHGEVYGAWLAALADMGLQRYQEPWP